jgi:WhiB family redox-sensing transcriptional regulator
VTALNDILDVLEPEAITQDEWAALRPATPVPLPSLRPEPLVTPAPVGDQEWIALGNCRDVDTALFFPPRGGNFEAPKAVCAGCVVRAECLTHALDHPEHHGIWGGTSERERRALRRARRRARAEQTG